MNKEFAELVEELRTQLGLSQTALAVLAWPEKGDRQNALVKYQRVMRSETISMADGAALARALNQDLARLVVLAQERERERNAKSNVIKLKSD